MTNKNKRLNLPFNKRRLGIEAVINLLD